MEHYEYEHNTDPSAPAFIPATPSKKGKNGVWKWILLPLVSSLIGGAIGGVIAGLLLKKLKAVWLHRALGLFIIWGGIRLLIL